jgi:cell division protein FtsW
MDFINKIFRGDRVIWMILLFLCLISIVEVYSASSTLAYRQNYWDPIVRHTLFLLAGVGVVLLAHSIKPKFFSLLAVALPLTWILLVLTKIFGVSINSADRWLTIAGFSFQPSELAKLCLIAATAFLLSRMKDSPNDKEKTFKWILIAAIITCGIIFLDNFSTAAMLFITVVIMMFVGQMPLKKIGVLLLALILFGSISLAGLLFLPSNVINSVFPRGITWKERIKDFTHKDNITNGAEFVINDDNYQVSHAKMAVAQGGILGKMPGKSTERDFLPQAYSDFIYAIIIEEMGLVGGFCVMFLYVIFFIRAGMIANRCKTKFPKYLVMGSALLVVSQALANMAVAVTLIPVTGQPLPLISRGGTSTLITCIYIGIILSVSRFENPKGMLKEEEINAQAQEEATTASALVQQAFEEENINAGEF